MKPDLLPTKESLYQDIVDQTTAAMPAETKQSEMDRWENEGGHVSKNPTRKVPPDSTNAPANSKGRADSTRVVRQPTFLQSRFPNAEARGSEIANKDQKIQL